jgi:uncharacterized SAM-binding protein YcdF (DUF218 family)
MSVTKRARVKWWVAGLACGVVVGPLLAGLSPLSRWLSVPLVVGESPRRADAVVVLGAGAYDTEVLTPHSSYRLVRGLQLWRQGYAPVLIFSGGGHRQMPGTDAKAMASTAQSLGVPPAVVLLDPEPTSTREQALSVARIAQQHGIVSVLLVTSPLASRRATQAFRRTGLTVIPVARPVAPLVVAQDNVAGRLALTSDALYEYVALAWYAWRGWI